MSFLLLSDVSLKINNIFISSSWSYLKFNFECHCITWFWSDKKMHVLLSNIMNHLIWSIMNTLGMYTFRQKVRGTWYFFFNIVFSFIKDHRSWTRNAFSVLFHYGLDHMLQYESYLSEWVVVVFRGVAAYTLSRHGVHIGRLKKWNKI